jgi:hypothetical protein
MSEVSEALAQNEINVSCLRQKQKNKTKQKNPPRII